MTGVLLPPFQKVFGTGAPGAGVPHSAMYFDNSTVPYTPYIYAGGAWHIFGSGGGGNNATSIQGINVDATTPTTGQALLFDGTKYKPTTVSNSPSLVQFVNQNLTAGGGVSGVTLPNPPTDGNLLLAFCGYSSSNIDAGGWTQFISDGSGTSYTHVAWRFTGPGEPALVPIYAAPHDACIVLYEIANGAPSQLWTSLQQSSATPGANFSAGRGGALLLGMIMNDAGTAGPTGATNATLLGSATNTSPDAIQGWKNTNPTHGNTANAISFTFASSGARRLCGVCVE